jgi:hypothetical protein
VLIDATGLESRLVAREDPFLARGSDKHLPTGYQVLHCTALHCTALHCTALHCTALHCPALHCTALHCTALYCAHVLW